MAGNLENKYGLNNQPIVCTIVSLPVNGQRASAAIDNSANLFTDILVTVKAKTGTSGVSASGTINVYACGSTDGGVTYSDNVAAGDATCTLTSPPNAALIGVINCVANAAVYVGGPFSVANNPLWKGSLPDHIVIVIENKTGAVLDPSIGSAWYQGMMEQYT